MVLLSAVLEIEEWSSLCESIFYEGIMKYIHDTHTQDMGTTQMACLLASHETRTRCLGKRTCTVQNMFFELKAKRIHRKNESITRR